MNHRSIAVATGIVLAALASSPAQAHFKLVAPEAFSQQNALGDPQKAPPCGGAGVVPTGAVTSYEEGSLITITIDETITHPGHYRVQIAQDEASIPENPPVTPGSTACGSTVIDQDPTMPLLADGELVHTSAFAGPQTFQVQLPPGFTCNQCVLQVAEFMSNHGLNNPGGCFYQHCATVNIVAAGSLPDAGPQVDGGGGPTADAAPGTADGGSNETGESPGACGCRVAPGPSASLGALLGGLLLGLVALVRRRSR